MLGCFLDVFSNKNRSLWPKHGLFPTVTLSFFIIKPVWLNQKGLKCCEESFYTCGKTSASVAMLNQKIKQVLRINPKLLMVECVVVIYSSMLQFEVVLEN